MKSTEHSRIYKKVSELLTRSPRNRAELVTGCLGGFGLSEAELGDRSAGSRQNILRGLIGELINEMHESGIIGLDRMGRYFLVTDAPVVVRIERCEREIIKALTEEKKTKAELRDGLMTAIGAAKTATRRDDDLVSN